MHVDKPGAQPPFTGGEQIPRNEPDPNEYNVEGNLKGQMGHPKLPEELEQRLTEIAESEEISAESLVLEALAEFCEQYALEQQSNPNTKE